MSKNNSNTISKNVSVNKSKSVSNSAPDLKLNTEKIKTHTKIEIILDKIDKKIAPDVSVVKDADLMVDRINSELKTKKINAKCVKGGSIAKGTFLKDDYDVDLFVRFDKSYQDKEISDLLENIIASVCKKLKVDFKRIHGSRDYFQFKYSPSNTSLNTKKNKDLSFEIIPVIMVHKSNEYEANNSTDLSPEHVEWVLNNVKKNSELPRNIRLAKQFLKSCKIYGAESYINGFSGHVVDILIVHFKSFINMITYFGNLETKNLTKPIIIDTDKRLIDPIKQLNENKITPLIIVDPIQSNRNSSAAVSKKSLEILIQKSKEFLKNPYEKYFEIKEFDLENEIKVELKNVLSKIYEKNIKNNIKTVILNIKTLNNSKDITGTKILKYYKNLISHLELNDFKVYSSGWNFDYEEKKSQIYLIINSKISINTIQIGPPIPNNSSNDKSKENYKKFIDKHTKEKNKILNNKQNGRVEAIIKRKFSDALLLIKELNKKDFMKSKVTKIEEKYY
jgi:tRNA nucleotidyltransferase (CCA-adding enzyme)